MRSMGYTLTYDDELEKSIWRGYPDPNYQFEEEDILSYERIVVDEDGNDVLVKTYKEPYEIIADFKLKTVVSLASPEIEREVPKKFGGSLKGFVWLDNISGDGEVILPFTAPHIFIARGSQKEPVIEEIFTKGENYYRITEDKTHVFVKSFSGVGGAAGAPPTLIAHYKMNDNLATDVIIDETGNHNGAVKDATGTATSAFHSVAGKINLAQDFDGTDDHIEITDHADFSPGNAVAGSGTPLSISAWVYMHDATNFYITTKGQLNNNAEWWFRLSDDKVYMLFFDNSVTSCYIGRKYDTVLTPYENQWIHLVATYDGGTLSSGIKIYLNGVRIDDVDNELNPASFVAVENLASPVYIGKYLGTYANGLIDNVMFFSKELSLDETKRIFNNGHGTEILAEVDEPRLLLRRNNSQFGLRSR